MGYIRENYGINLGKLWNKFRETMGYIREIME